MDPSPLNSTGNDSSSNRTIALIKVVLESGHSVELPATGYSMFPTLRPGDSVVVKPIESGEFPKPGTVVVYEENSVLVMHRLIEILDDGSGKLMFISRGDSMIERDKPWSQQKLLGIADNYKRGKMGYRVKPFVPGILRYKLNYRLLWLNNILHF